MIEKFVFISYSSKEYAEATKVCIFLESKGIKCWMAPRNITPGASYASQIVSAINECSALVLLASQDSNDSGHVSNEISIAFDKKKTIIPFRLKEFDFSDEFIYFLGRKHWINAFENFDKGLDLLLHTLIPILDSKEIIQEEPTKDENIKDESSTSDKSHNEKEYITCSRCYTKNEKTSAFCSQCGHPFKSNTHSKAEKKYCTKCGSEMPGNFAVCTNCGNHFHQDKKTCPSCNAEMPSKFPVCTNCGYSFNSETKLFEFNKSDNDPSPLQIIALVLMILASIVLAFSFFFIPLLWCIPMTIYYANNIRKQKSTHIAFKICTILFLGIIPGVIMLFDD